VSFESEVAMKFQHIVLPTDFSENADAAVPYAVDFAKRDGGKIYLVNVIDDALYLSTIAEDAFGVATAAPAEWTALLRKEHEANLESRAALLSASEGVEVVPMLRRGNAPMEIVKVADEVNAGAIVIATHGRSGLSHLVFGSVAERVVRHSTRPVLTVRPVKVPVHV
jgi:universal stress protein A